MYYIAPYHFPLKDQKDSINFQTRLYYESGKAQIGLIPSQPRYFPPIVHACLASTFTESQVSTSTFWL